MQTINLDLTPSGVSPVVHASQFDVGREIGFYLYEDGEECTIPSTATVYVEGTKSDNHAFSYSSADDGSVISFSGNAITILTTEQMTAAAGNARCEIKIKTDDATLYTANFILDVESSALPSDSDMSATDIPMIKKAADAGDKIDTLSDKIDKAEELIKQVEDNVMSAETSAANAKTSETNAAASATSASSSASAASTSATNAANSATAAKNSQTSAASYATQSKNQATNAATSATNAANSATASADSAKLSESWAIGGTSSRSGEDTNNSKYYAEQAAKSAQEAAGSITGVATWNGRAGSVKPQSGDYTADMVGAVSEEAYNTKVTEIDKAVDGKAAKATTLAGYGITDAIKSINISGKTVTVTMSDGTTKTLTTQDTTYNNATASTAGLMTAADKKKLDGVAEGATKVTVDSALSASSTNPVQNKVVNTALSTKADSTTVETLQTEGKFTVSASGWSSTTVTVNGGTYYTYTLSCTDVAMEHPIIGISGATNIPTADEQTAYDCMSYAVADTTANTITLYAETLPTVSFYIIVKGAK